MIVPAPRAAERSPARIGREFRRRVAAGLRILPSGSARSDPQGLLHAGYTPRHRIDLFDTTFYLTGVRQNEYIRFFVAYVTQGSRAWPRIFYKDVSLIWRSASHTARLGGHLWIGKGDTTTYYEGGAECLTSREETTDLPVELQSGLEEVLRTSERIPTDHRAPFLVLHHGPEGRIEPYRDFSGPRRRAQANASHLPNRGRRVARFTRRNDPTSLRFTRGYEPDFQRGVLEEDGLRSRLYGGRVRRFRILSTNREIQYLFMASPRHVWIIPPQATTTELSSFGLRLVDVVADDDLFVPGYEYHFVEDDGSLFSQIPKGFAGPPSPQDENRADASPWIDKLPVVRDFRRRVLGRS